METASFGSPGSGCAVARVTLPKRHSAYAVHSYRTSDGLPATGQLHRGVAYLRMAKVVGLAKILC